MVEKDATAKKKNKTFVLRKKIYVSPAATVWACASWDEGNEGTLEIKSKPPASNGNKTPSFLSAVTFAQSEA